MPHVRSLTIASDGVGVPLSLSLFLRTFRTLPNIEHLAVATMDPISQVPPFWSAIDAICGSGRVYDTLATVEFYFSSPPPASGPEHMKREELREKLPYLAGHGMLKVSDPNVYVLGGLDISWCINLTSWQGDGLVAVLIYRTFPVPLSFRLSALVNTAPHPPPPSSMMTTVGTETRDIDRLCSRGKKGFILLYGCGNIRKDLQKLSSVHSVEQ